MRSRSRRTVGRSPQIPRQGRLTIARDGLGILMRNARLGLRDAPSFSGWTAERGESNRLNIKTDQPRTGWVLELGLDALIVSSTSNDGVLTAEVPASPDRIVARTMDPQGVPVDSIGTQEVAEGYGGAVTHNRSYLPRQNSDVLYFALGQVSASTLHRLFDRKRTQPLIFLPTQYCSAPPLIPACWRSRCLYQEIPSCALCLITSQRRWACHTTRPSTIECSAARPWCGRVGPTTTKRFVKRTS